MEDMNYMNTEMEQATAVATEVDNESKSEKFIRLAQGRVTRARKAITLLEHLSNTSAYEYTEAQIEQMFTALEEELASVKASFKKTDKEEKRFSFQ